MPWSCLTFSIKFRHLKSYCWKNFKNWRYKESKLLNVIADERNDNFVPWYTMLEFEFSLRLKKMSIPLLGSLVQTCPIRGYPDGIVIFDYHLRKFLWLQGKYFWWNIFKKYWLYYSKDKVSMVTLSDKKWHWRARVSPIQILSKVPSENFTWVLAFLIQTAQ